MGQPSGIDETDAMQVQEDEGGSFLCWGEIKE